jgi:4-hydroxybenzoate decarboxylase
MMELKDIHGLREFLAFLAERKQCVTWPEEIALEPDIYNVAVANRDSARSPAIVFDRITGYPGHRIALGVHGSFANIALLLGLPPSTPVKEIFAHLISRWGQNEKLLHWIAPEQAPVNENRIERNINLYELLPLYRVNEFDGGFFIAKACTASRDPRDPDNFGKQNVGIYRIQVQGPDLFTLDSVASHDMGRQIQMAEADGSEFKIAVMIGNHPAMVMFAGTPIDYEESEYAYASQMMGLPLVLTQSGNGVDILAHSEFVIEATLLNNQREFEGPFGEFMGSYSGVNRSPLFKVTAVSHRNDPLFENIYIGKGWNEHDTLIGLHTCTPIYAHLKAAFPEVQAVNALYQHGMTVIIAVKNRFAGFAKSVAMRALGSPHGLMYLKNLILVDEDIDPFDLGQVMWALSARTRAEDVILLPHMPIVDADPAAVIPGIGHRLIIDATSYVHPEQLGGTAQHVRLATGPTIDRLTRVILSLQQAAGTGTG